ncbi:MAG: hypothetical protein RLZZ488_2846 [Pseudomonadota bacterium]|jgi:hypothetical protein
MKSTVIGTAGLALFLISCAAAEPTTALNPARNGDTTVADEPAGSVNQVGTGDVSQAGGKQTGGTTGGATTGGQTKGPATGTSGGAAVDAAFSTAAKKCTGCHTGSGASGGFQLSSTDPQDWVNKKNKILSRVNNADNPMPPGGLSDADKAAFLAVVGSLKPQ